MTNGSVSFDTWPLFADLFQHFSNSAIRFTYLNSISIFGSTFTLIFFCHRSFRYFLHLFDTRTTFFLYGLQYFLSLIFRGWSESWAHRQIRYRRCAPHYRIRRVVYTRWHRAVERKTHSYLSYRQRYRRLLINTASYNRNSRSLRENPSPAPRPEVRNHTCSSG